MEQVYIIAEAGVNHNGDIDLALRLCDVAKEAGVDAIKFQTWKTEKLLTKDTNMAQYQVENTGIEQSQFDMLKKLELTYSQFINIKKYCDSIGLQFLSTPDEEESLAFLVSLGVEIIKVGSGEISNLPYLRKIGKTNKDVILSTGMSYLSEVETAYYELLNSGAKSIALLHCTTNYPCPMDEVNLNAMLTLKKAFKVKVGYSDHTMGIEVPIAAVALGAEIIEKHFTLDKTMEGPDHSASLDPSELKEMVKAIRNIEKAMGNGLKVPNSTEIEIKKVVQKTIVASVRINKGEQFTENNITAKRANSGLPISQWEFVVGKIAQFDFEPDESIRF